MEAHGLTIAVLALQGAFAEHAAMLARLGVETFEVRNLGDWQRHKDGLILPGGESTSQTNLLGKLGLLQSIRQAILEGLPVLATCAGMILLARQEDGKPRCGLSTMDIDVCRNAYGRQLGSFQTSGDVGHGISDFPMTFIRAPYVRDTLAPSVEILSVVDGRTVGVRQGQQIALAFHPEVTSDVRIHSAFIEVCKKFHNEKGDV